MPKAFHGKTSNLVCHTDWVSLFIRYRGTWQETYCTLTEWLEGIYE